MSPELARFIAREDIERDEELYRTLLQGVLRVRLCAM